MKQSIDQLEKDNKILKHHLVKAKKVYDLLLILSVEIKYRGRTEPCAALLSKTDFLKIESC